METKLIVSEMKKLQEEVSLLQGLFVPSVGRKGELALLWKFDIRVELRSLNQWFIDVCVNFGEEIGKWLLTGFYENLETHRRDDSWALLEKLGKLDDSPWVCIEDFNEVLSVNEKGGGADRPSRQIEKFRCCLESTGLRDMGYSGSWFTWDV